MAYSNKKRQEARSLYVFSRYSLPVVSITLDISEGTLSRWKRDAKSTGDDWDMARSAAIMAGDGFEKLVSDAVEGFTIMFQATMSEIKEAASMPPSEKVKMMASLSDAFNKMINASGRAAPNLSKLGIATNILQMMAEFIRDDFPNHADAFMEILEPFGLKLAKEYNQ